MAMAQPGPGPSDLASYPGSNTRGASSGGGSEGLQCDGLEEVAQIPDQAGKQGSGGKLSLRIKMIFGIGECVQGIYVMIGGYYLNSFLLETACIDPMYVGLMQAIQGVFDAINDPIIGSLSDRTRTRWGRRRPWLLFAAPFLALFYFGLWNTLPPGVPQFWKFVFALSMYMGVSIGITSIQVQIGALVPELTDDYDERTAVSGWRIGTMSVVGLAAAVGHNMIVNLRSGGHDGAGAGFRISGAVFAVVMWSASWIFFAGITEKWSPKQETRKQLGIFSSICTLFKNKAFICVAGAYLCGPTAVCLIQSNLFMLCKYMLGDADILKKVIPIVQGSGLVCLPLWVLMGRWFDKRVVYIIGGSVLTLSLSSIYFINSELQALICSAVIGMCVSIPYLVPYSMLPDVIDEDELRTGKRREGLYVGFFTIMLKFSVTGSLTMTNWLLKGMGYQAPVGFCSADGATQPQEEEELDVDQPAQVIFCIRLLCSFIPAFFMICATLLVWFFPITRKKQAAMAKLAAQARLERCAQQSETSSVTSTHSPRDLQALTDFINETKEVEEEAVLNEMQKVYADVRFQEYHNKEFSQRPVRFKDEPRANQTSRPVPVKVGAGDEDNASNIAETATTVSAAHPSASVASAGTGSAPVSESLSSLVPAECSSKVSL